MTESTPAKSKKKTSKKKEALLLKMSHATTSSTRNRSLDPDDALIRINPFFDDFVDCIENLPSRLQLLLTELRNVDVLVKARHRKLYAIKQEIIARSESSENEETKGGQLDQLLHKLHQLLVQCQTLGDQKVRLTGQIIEAIGAKTRQLGFDARSNEAKFNLEIDEEKILSEFKLACKKNRPIHHHYNVPGANSANGSRSSSRQIQQNLSTKPKQLAVELTSSSSSSKKVLNKKGFGINRDKDAAYSFDDSSNLSNSPLYPGVIQQLNGHKNNEIKKKAQQLNHRVVQSVQLNGAFKASLELKQRSAKKIKSETETYESKNQSDSSTQLATTRSKRQLNFSNELPAAKKTLNQSLKLNKKRRLSLSKNGQSSSSSSSSNQCKSPSSLSSSSSTSSYNASANKYLTNNTNNTNQSTNTTKTSCQTSLVKQQKENIKFKQKKPVKRLQTRQANKKEEGEEGEDCNEAEDMESECYESDDEISADESEEKRKEAVKKEAKSEEKEESDRNSNETESINNLEEEDEAAERDETDEHDEKTRNNKRVKQEGEDDERTKKKSTRNSRTSLPETVQTNNATVKVIKAAHDEPLYCLCREISYGQMIMCDNDACNIEWFHFNCVKLTSKPKGKWYCPQCRGDTHKVMKKSHLQASTSSNLSSPNYYNNYQSTYTNRNK